MPDILAGYHCWRNGVEFGMQSCPSCQASLAVCLSMLQASLEEMILMKEF